MPRRVVIGVGIAGHPVSAAGNTWAFLQWALGFRALGWEVFLAEEVNSTKCIDSNWKPAPFFDSANRSHWERTVEEFGFYKSSALLVDGVSPRRKELLSFAKGADLFLNVSGHFKDQEILQATRRRVYLDLDPAFTQIWAEVYAEDMNFEGHDDFVTVGPLLNQERCRSPKAGKKWLETFPPVDLTYWPWQESEPEHPWTTMTHWYGYPPVEYQGEWYGNKSEEFEKIIGLPARAGVSLEVATDLPKESEEYLRFTGAGWKIREGHSLNEPWQCYQNYLGSSRGEFSVAKNGYVKSHCGWFSDRSVCYLAMGRPVILQETGWSEVLPSGEGLISFRDESEAAQAIQRVESDYLKHRRAARALAEKYFSAPRVVERLLEKLRLI